MVTVLSIGVVVRHVLTIILHLPAALDGPWLLAVSGPHADEGGEILEGMYAQGCIRMHKCRGFTHTWKIWKGRRPRYRFGGRVNVFCSGNVYTETIRTNVITY
jgi:hypothetical protein